MKSRLFICSLMILLVGALGLNAQVSNDVWTGGGPGTNWSTANNWTLGVPPMGINSNVFFSNTPPGAYTSTVDSNYTLANLDIDLVGGLFTLNQSGGSTLTILTQVLDQSANNVVINVPITGAGTFAMGLLGGGVGTLTLNTTGNTWTNDTRIVAGTLADGVSNAFSPNSLLLIGTSGVVQVNFNETIKGLSDDFSGGLGSLTIASGATLFINGGASTTFTGAITGNGGIEMDTAGQLRLSGTNTYSGTTVLNTGTTLVDSAASSGLSPNSLMTVNAGSALDLSFNETVAGLSSVDSGGTVNLAPGVVLSDATTGPVSFQGNIIATGSLTIGGFGSQALSGMSTYSGGTTVQSELFVGSSTNGPPGSFTAGPVGTGPVTFIISGELSPSAPNVTLANSMVLMDDGYVDNDDGGTNNLTLTGLISGFAGFEWCTPGIFELTGANMFTGGVDMREGTLLLGNSTVSVLGSIVSGPIGTGFLQLDTGSVVAAGLPSVSLANNVFLTGNTQFGNGPTDTNALDLSGPISGSGNITYSAATTGSLTLDGTNIYTGTTFISGGTVFVNSNQAFGSPMTNTVTLHASGGQTANLSVNGIATLSNPITSVGTGNVISGSGTIASAVTIDGTVTLSPGNPLGSPIGALTFTNGLTLVTNGSISFNLIDANGTFGVGYGYFNVTGGTLDLTGAAASSLAFNVNTINASGSPAMAVNFNSSNPYSWMFGQSSSAISGFLAGGAQFNILTGGFQNPTNGGTFSISENGMNQLFLNFTPVPEPSTWELLGLGILSVVPLALRRHRGKPA